MAVCSSQRVLITLVIVLSVVAVVLVAVLIWRETREEEKLKLTSENAQKTYSSNFRTKQQQELYLKKYMEGFESRNVIKTKIPALNGTCEFSCRQIQQRRKRVVAGGVNHGCCVSTVPGFVDPITKINIFGQNRTLVQFSDVKQYFAEHQCQSVSGCTGCVCSQGNNLHTAVVLKTSVSVSDAEYIEDTETDLFFFPGCCKCINT